MINQNFTPLNLNKFKAHSAPQSAAPAPHQTSIVRRPSYLPQVVLTLALILTLGISVYFFNRNQNNQTTTTQAALENGTPLLDLVGKLIALPEGEKPTIATVTDRSQLPDQPFFKNAENNDKILVYTNAKRAILYRPSVNKIVDMGPVGYNSEDVSGASTSSANLKTSPTPKVGTGRVIFKAVSPTPTEIILNTNPASTSTPSASPSP